MAPSTMVGRAFSNPIFTAVGVSVSASAVYKVVSNLRAHSEARAVVKRKPKKWPSPSAIAVGTYERVQNRQHLLLTFYGCGLDAGRDVRDTIVMIDLRDHSVDVVEYLNDVWFLEMPQELGTIWSVGTDMPRRLNAGENPRIKRALMTVEDVRRMVMDLRETITRRTHVFRITDYAHGEQPKSGQLLLPWYGHGTNAVCEVLLALKHTTETKLFPISALWSKLPRDFYKPRMDEPLEHWLITYDNRIVWKYGITSLFVMSSEKFIDSPEEAPKKPTLRERRGFTGTIVLPGNKDGMPAALPTRVKGKTVLDFKKFSHKIGLLDAESFHSLVIRIVLEYKARIESQRAGPNPSQWPPISEMDEDFWQLRYPLPEHPLEMDEFKRRCDSWVTKNHTEPDYAAIQASMKKGEEKGRSWLLKRIKLVYGHLIKAKWDVRDSCDIDPYADVDYDDEPHLYYHPPDTGLTDVGEEREDLTAEEEAEQRADIIALALRCVLEQDWNRTSVQLKAHLQYITCQMEWNWGAVPGASIFVGQNVSKYEVVQISGPTLLEVGVDRLIVNCMTSEALQRSNRLCAALVEEYSLVIDVIEMWTEFPDLFEIFKFDTAGPRPVYVPTKEPRSTYVTMPKVSAKQHLAILPPVAFPTDDLSSPRRTLNKFGLRVDTTDTCQKLEVWKSGNVLDPVMTIRAGENPLKDHVRHIFSKESFRELVTRVASGFVTEYEPGTGGTWSSIPQLLEQPHNRDLDVRDYIPWGVPKNCTLDYSPLMHDRMEEVYEDHMKKYGTVPALKDVFDKAEELYHLDADELVYDIEQNLEYYYEHGVQRCKWNLWKIDSVYDEEYRPTGDEDSGSSEESSRPSDPSSSGGKRTEEEHDERYDKFAHQLYVAVRFAGRDMDLQWLLTEIRQFALFLFGVPMNCSRPRNASTPPTSDGSGRDNKHTEEGMRSSPANETGIISVLPEQVLKVSRIEKPEPWLEEFGKEIVWPKRPLNFGRYIPPVDREAVHRAQAEREYHARQARLGYNGNRRANADAKRPPPPPVLFKGGPKAYVRRQHELNKAQNPAAGYQNGTNYSTIFDEFGRLFDAAGQERVQWVNNRVPIHAGALDTAFPNALLDLENQVREEDFQEKGKRPATPINKFHVFYEELQIYENRPMAAKHQPEVVRPANMDKQGNLYDANWSPIYLQKSDVLDPEFGGWLAPQTHGVPGLGHVDIPADMWCRPLPESNPEEFGWRRAYHREKEDMFMRRHGVNRRHCGTSPEGRDE